MTPIALTPAARSKKTKPPQRQSGRSATAQATTTRKSGHRASVRRAAAPTAPRRVSGPTRTAARTAVADAPRRRLRRRVSGPARPAARPRARRAGAGESLGARALAFVKALPDHQLLDRIVRGRAWIPLLGVLLAGIVAMQVEVLKLGAGIGRSIERGTELQSRNELLRASVAGLADDRRIERLAAGMGMVMPTADAIDFLSLRPVGYVPRAAASIHQPDAAAFKASLPVTDSSTNPSAASTDPSAASTNPSAASTDPSAASTDSTAVTGGATTTGGAAATSAAADTGTSPSSVTTTPTGG
jgi:hypothetical protein